MSKGTGGTGDMEVHFTVKKKFERFSEGKDFYGFWWIFLKNKKDFGQWCMIVLGSEMPVVGR